MSTYVNMMASNAVEPALAKRLESLTGEDAADCALDLRELADAARTKPAFAGTLARAKALADENRLLVAALLKRRGSLCGCEVQAALGLTHATVSHHMGALKDAGLVTAEKRGKWVHYALVPEFANVIP